jgi:hypothetical protein
MLGALNLLLLPQNWGPGGGSSGAMPSLRLKQLQDFGFTAAKTLGDLGEELG